MDVFNEIGAVWSQWCVSAWSWFVATEWGAYLTADPTGQRVALGIALASLLLGGWLAVKFGRAVVKRCRYVPMVLLVALGAYYASVLALRLDPNLWAPAAGVAALTLFVLGLGSVVAAKVRMRSRGRGESKPRRRLATA